MIGVIAWREFRAHGHNLTLWLLLAALQGMLAWLLFAQLDAYRGISAQLVAAQSSLGINDLVIAPSLNSLGILLLLATPLLGMHALSDERRSGHLQVLLSSPLSVTQLLLGKWLGNVLGGLLMYWLGAALAEEAIQPLVSMLDAEDTYQQTMEKLKTDGFATLFMIGITPFPFQVGVAAAGAAGYNLVLFTLAVALSRSIRYFLLAGLVMLVGDKAEKMLKDHELELTIVGVILFAAFVVYFFVF